MAAMFDMQISRFFNSTRKIIIVDDLSVKKIAKIG